MKKFVLFLILMSIFIVGCGNKNASESDTVKWINTTHALLTKVNNGDFNTYGGVSNNPFNKTIMKVSLEKSWGIKDRTSAEETIQWLLESGHRADYIKEMELLKKRGILNTSSVGALKILSNYSYDKEKIGLYMHLVKAYKISGAGAIDAWDYCRALYLLSSSYIAGYFTKEEALENSLNIAKMLQKRFNSWEELVESYLVGYAYWAEDNPKNENSMSFERRRVYNEILKSDNNPYKIDWNLNLEK